MILRSLLVESVPRLRRSGILIRLPTALPWANLRARLPALGLSWRVRHSRYRTAYDLGRQNLPLLGEVYGFCAQPAAFNATGNACSRYIESCYNVSIQFKSKSYL